MTTGQHRYAMLLAPSANRVYSYEAPRLAEAELSVFAGTVWGSSHTEVSQTERGGVPYLEFTVEKPVHDRELAYLARVSTGFALFEVVGDLLRPITLPPYARYDDDLITIPKYAGKTNEQFTQLLLNVTVLSSGFAGELVDRRLVVLDPLAGRATTLHHALRYGYDAIGIEIDSGHVEAESAFLRSYLRRKRLKHTVDLNPVRRDGKRIGRRLSAVLAPTRDAYRAGDTQRITVFQADTTDTRGVLRSGCCDVIVTDAPYGVAHRSRSARETHRSPVDLLARAVPRWAELLRTGGAVGLSFNSHTADRRDVEELLTGAGLSVVDGLTGFAHWVDQGIVRDLVVATKSG